MIDPQCSCILGVDSRETREAARERLIGSLIHPAVPYPLERPVPARAVRALRASQLGPR